MSEMNKWIELNLPYNVFDSFDYKSNKPPSVEKLAIKELGFGEKEIDRLYSKLDNDFYPEGDVVQRIIADINKQCSELFQSQSVEWQNHKVMLCSSHEHSEVKRIGEWLDKRYQYWNWYESQPDIIAHDKKVSEKEKTFQLELSKKSFVGLGLNVPGTLVEVDVEGKIDQYLIGHINSDADVWDDHAMFDEKSIVLRYMAVWKKEELK